MRRLETGQDPPRTKKSSRPEPPEPYHFPEQLRSRAVLVMAGFIVAFFAVTGLVLYFKPFSDSPPVGEPSLDIFAAGPYEIYEPGTITHFENERFFLIRLADGAFLALYDLAPLNQARVEEGDITALLCRISVRNDDEMAEWLTATSPIPGFHALGLYDECSDGAWDARGRPVRGAQSGDLDRFPVEATGEIVRVNLGERRCLNDVTSYAPCISTQ